MVLHARFFYFFHILSVCFCAYMFAVLYCTGVHVCDSAVGTYSRR